MRITFLDIRCFTSPGECLTLLAAVDVEIFYLLCYLAGSFLVEAMSSMFLMSHK